MKTIARFAAFLIALILIFSIPVSMLLFNTGHVLFDPVLVKTELAVLVTESDLIPAGLNWYIDRERAASDAPASGGTELDIGELLSYLDTDDWRAVRGELLPNDLLMAWVDVTVDGTYNWLDGDDHAPQISWNLQPIIDRIHSSHGVNVTALVVDSLPPCTQQQLDQLKASLIATLIGKTPTIIYCRFPDPWTVGQIALFTQALPLAASNIPSALTLTDALERNPDIGGLDLSAIKTQLLLIRTTARLAVFVPLLLLLLILILAVRSWKMLARWWGYSLALGGLLTTLLSGFSRTAASMLLSAAPLAKIPPLIREDVHTGIMRLAMAVTSPLQTQALVLLLAGLVLIMMSMLIKGKTP